LLCQAPAAAAAAADQEIPVGRFRLTLEDVGLLNSESTEMLGNIIPIENGEIFCVTPACLSSTLDVEILPYRDQLIAILRKRGAILFRGFPIQDSADFDRFCTLLGPRVADYAGGTSPRIKVGSGVYTSTEYPATATIAMHNEMSYKDIYPDFIYFYCATPPAQGGETPIADSRKVLASLPQRVVDAFEARGVSYIRNMIDSAGSFGSWQRVFETDSRSVVEALCDKQGIGYQWDAYGTLHTEERRPATRVHARTGEKVWFNQAHMWHISNGAPDLDLDDIDEADLPMNAAYGDRGSIETESLTAIRDAFKRHSMHFAWQQRDILLLDNVLMAHGRMPFKGERRILVAMGLDR
jgi:hypothetical protein